MAFVVTDRGTADSGGFGSSLTVSSSFTPAKDDFILACVQIDSGNSVSSVTGHASWSITFELIHKGPVNESTQQEVWGVS